MDKAVIASYEKHGLKFEIYVDPSLSLEIKKGNKKIEDVSLDDLLAAQEVYKDAPKVKSKKFYKDAPKVERVSDESLIKVFQTTDLAKVVEEIIKHGRVQLTTEQMRELREKIFLEIVDLISRNAINPQTQTPHPPQRIENALREARFAPNILKKAEDQVEEAISKIKSILPISMEKIKIDVFTSLEHGGRLSGALRKYKVLKEEWLSNGYHVVIEMPAGLKNSFFNELNKITKGENKTSVLDQ